jgi:hypothetical protein
MEESDLSKNILTLWKEQTIEDRGIPLLSNLLNDSKTISKIHSVSNDNGMVIEIITSEIDWMSNIPIGKYFIYSDLSTNLINSNSKFISIPSLDLFNYNNYTIDNKKVEHYSFIKYNSNINCFMLGSGNSKTWNLVRINDQSLTLIDSSGNNSLKPQEFLSRLIANDIYFIIGLSSSIEVLQYNLNSDTIIFRKSLNRNSSSSRVMIDHIGNIIEFTGYLITIFPISSQYESFINYPYRYIYSQQDQIMIEYKNRNIYILQNTIDNQFETNLEYFNFNLDSSQNSTLASSMLQISNTSSNALFILDFVIDPSSMFVVCNLSDLSRIFYHPLTKKVYKFPNILNIQFDQYQLTDQKMIHTKEKKIVNVASYYIYDTAPNQFYHEYYSQFFNAKKLFQLLSYYEFYDKRIIVELVENNIYLNQRKGGDANGSGGTIRKMVFAPDSDKFIKNYKLDKDNNRLGVVEQSKVGKYGCLKIYDVSGLENKIYQKDFSGNEICSDTLALLNDKSFYISERDLSGQENLFYLWKITDTSQNYLFIQTDFSGCIYSNPYYDHFFLDEIIDDRIVLWKFYNNQMILNQKLTDLKNHLSFEFNDRLIHIKDNHKLYLFGN